MKGFSSRAIKFGGVTDLRGSTTASAVTGSSRISPKDPDNPLGPGLLLGSLVRSFLGEPKLQGP